MRYFIRNVAYVDDPSVIIRTGEEHEFDSRHDKPIASVISWLVAEFGMWNSLNKPVTFDATFITDNARYEYRVREFQK